MLQDVGSAVTWLRSQGVQSLTTDSRRVQAGDAFIAWPGYANDGREFVKSALDAGAAACVVEAKGAEAFGFDDARVATLAELKAATGPLASAYFEHPSQRLSVVAVTGTNGKTSCAWWMAQALSLLGQRCGVIGTLGVGEPPSAVSPEATVQSTGLTTPDPVTLQQAFRSFVDQGFKACAIEASSIGIVEQRLAATRIAVALFTNFTRDHLDYHGSMEAYWAAKAQLFTWPGLRAAVLNVDDEHGASMAGELGDVDVWTYSVRQPARLRADRVRYEQGGLAFELREGELTANLQTSLIGDYNVANLLAVIGGLRALGIPLVEAAGVCVQLTAVPGRMQRVHSLPLWGRAGVGASGVESESSGGGRGPHPPSTGSGQAKPPPAGEGANLPIAVVDYAHTPDALEKALQALRPFAQERQGQLWAVFGCGGNRDATKRPLMGEIADRVADKVVVTSDNPRNEAPNEILRQIVAGMPRLTKTKIIEDRRAAIAYAARNANANDVILIAGKGHEAEQEIAGIKHPFSDVAEAQAALDARSPA